MAWGWLREECPPLWAHRPLSGNPTSGGLQALPGIATSVVAMGPSVMQAVGMVNDHLLSCSCHAQ
ncbi:hypothetical protein D3C80_1872850 [compost metagenome]